MASKTSALNAIEQSPSWEKSREAIRRPIKKRKSRRCLAEELAASSTAVRSPAFLPPIDWDDSAARSPFDCAASEQIGQCPDDSTAAATFTFSTVASLDNTISSLYPVDFSHFNVNSAGNKSSSKSLSGGVQNSELKNVSARPPRDWRLGTRLRLVSDQPFPWLTARQSNTTGNYPVKLSETVFNNQENQQMASLPLASLQNAILFRQFPSIGAVQMFPRRSATAQNAVLKSANLQSIEANFMDTLCTQWAQALLSLLRTVSSVPPDPSKHCPSFSEGFFYVCAPQFTALFAAVAAAAEQQRAPHLVVVITPSTSGFQQILRAKGIEFTLPFKAAEFVELGREDCPRDFLTNVGDESIGMDHDEWLRDLGISPRSTLKLKQSTSELDASSISHLSNGSKNDSGTSDVGKIGDENTRSLLGTPDESSKSTVLIRGIKNAEAFCRLLISQMALCSTKTGPQAGLPPTLISNMPFRHNTLKELSLTSQGPVMSSTVEWLLNFVQTEIAKPNRVQIHVVGRAQCNGLNEALNAAMNVRDGHEGFGGTNFAELECFQSESLDGERRFGWN
uniref:Uncharacterized protein n=1 Tax=Globodera rostochiensis TaxID=31243 RepID=A0A914I8H3_GLORO